VPQGVSNEAGMKPSISFIGARRLATAREHGTLYRELPRRQLVLAERAGRLDEDQLQRMRELIKR
jgi:hypothetical protein